MPYLGGVILFAGTFELEGWMCCDGRELSIAQHQALFSILGTSYGGDGMKTFRLPDLRNRVPVQPEHMSQVGRVTGAPGVTITPVNLPYPVPVSAILPVVGLNYLMCAEHGDYPPRAD